MSKEITVSEIEELQPIEPRQLEPTLQALNIPPEFFETLGVDVSAPDDVCWNRLLGHYRKSVLELVSAGLYLMALKERTSHGSFVAELERHGLNRVHAHRATSAAKFVFANKGHEKFLLELPVSKLHVLAAADPEIVACMLENGLDDIKNATVQGLAYDLKAKREAVEKANEALAKSEEQVDRLMAERAHLLHGGVASVALRRMKVAAITHGAAIEASLAELDRVLLDAQAEQALSESERMAVARMVAMAAGAALAHLGALRERLTEEWDDLPAPLHALATDDLSDDERAWAAMNANKVKINLQRRIEQQMAHEQVDHGLKTGTLKSPYGKKSVGPQKPLPKRGRS